MAYYNKYIKYKTKYYILKNLIGGGDVDEFLSGYNEIPNSGQQNCGIFVSDIEQNFIIKCEEGNHLERKEFIGAKKLQELNIFPKIESSIYDDENDKTYIKMERLDGDLTQLLYEVTPKQILDDMDISPEEKEDIYNFFQLMIPKTFGGRIYINSFSDIELNIYNGSQQIDDELINQLYNTLKDDPYNRHLSSLINSLKKKLEIFKVQEGEINNYHQFYKERVQRQLNENEVMIKDNIKQTLEQEIVPDIIKQITEEKEKINQHIKPLNIENYTKFIKMYKPKFIIMMKFFYEKIDELIKQLEQNGYTFYDMKLDNFGYKGDKYYILDWSSGLSEYDIFNDNPRNVYDYQLSKYGQYSYNKIFHSLIFQRLLLIILIAKKDGTNINQHLVEFIQKFQSRKIYGEENEWQV